MRRKSKKAFYKFLCYATSFGAIFGSLLFSSMLFKQHHNNVLFFIPFLIILSAWICHLLMCIQWIEDMCINTFLIKFGTFSGLVSFCIFFVPPLSVFSGFVVFTLHCLLLIIYIIARQILFNKNKLST
jgi:hypothetical protein